MLRLIRLCPLVLLVFLAACSKSGTPTQDSATSSAAAPTASSTPAPAPDGAAPDGATADPPPASAFVKPVPAELPAVVARVNGEALSKADLEFEVQALEARARRKVPADERDRVLRGVLDQMIGFRLLLQESKNRKVSVPDAELDAQMQQIRARFPTEEAFNAALTEQKLTVEKVRTQNRQEMAVTKLLQAEVEAKSAVTPADVEKAYRENPDAFKVPEQVRASHILIKVDEGADAAMKADALGRANSVLKSAKAGKDFAALAKEFSQDPGSAAQGGDLGFFPPGQMVGPFNDVAFSLRPGTISGIVETQFGYHIIKVVEKKPGRTVPLEEARTQIEQRLLDMNRQRHVAAFVKSLRDKAKVEVLI